MLKPEITVASVIEKDGRFLLVEEETEYGIRLNQPAGHLEPDETIVDAAIREALEETACLVEPRFLVGVYHMQFSGGAKETSSFIRFTFGCEISRQYDQPLDPDILRTVWMTYDEIAACTDRHRSRLVMQSIDDYLKGQCAPLSVLSSELVERKS